MADPGLAAFFARLGHPVEDRPVHLDREGHLRRLQDSSVPVGLRESSVESVGESLELSETTAAIRKLSIERGTPAERLREGLWTRWRSRHSTDETAALLLELLTTEEDGEATLAWALEKAEEPAVTEDLANLLAQRIESRRLGDGLDAPTRTILSRLHDRALGGRLRIQLLALLEQPTPKEPRQGVADALGFLGLPIDVFEFIRGVIGSKSGQVRELGESVTRLERKLHDVLSSEEVAREIRRLVDESLHARETQLRTEWERSLEAARLGFAELCIDLGTFVSGLRSKTDEDTSVVGEILSRRLEQLLTSRLGLTIIGRPGEVVMFDSRLHEAAGDRPVIGETMLVVRPGIQKTRSDEVVAKAVVKRP